MAGTALTTGPSLGGGAQRPVAVRKVPHQQTVVAALVRPRLVPGVGAHHDAVVQPTHRALDLVEVGEVRRAELFEARRFEALVGDRLAVDGDALGQRR